LKKERDMEIMLKLFAVTVLLGAGTPSTGHASDVSWETEPLAAGEKARFERVSRAWVGKLWTNDYSDCKAGLDVRRYHSRPWTTHVDVRFRLHGELCVCGFVDKSPDKLTYIGNNLYRRIISYAGEKLHPPVHTAKEQARARVSEFAALFGVSNLWDRAHFSVYLDGGFNSMEECWKFDFWAVKNGYPFPGGVHVDIADLPGAPLASWHDTRDDVPPGQLPARAALSPEQARAKSLEYMKAYFPFHAAALHKGQILEKGDVLEIKCYTNMLEYIIPNYNYIRPAPGKGGLSDYVSRKREIALAWVNHLGTPEGSKYNISATIYVDAATGEMLGGSD
jgi:hypothetical protein